MNMVTFSFGHDSECGILTLMWFAMFVLFVCFLMSGILLYFIIVRTLHYQERVLPLYFSLGGDCHLLIKRNQYIISIMRYLGMSCHTNTNAKCL